MSEFEKTNFANCKKFINLIWEQKKTHSIHFTNLQNLIHLSNIITYISVAQDSVLSNNFEINFKIVYISEKIYYFNTTQNSNNKIYWSAILSKDKYYKTKWFWRDFLELKLVNKLIDYSKRLISSESPQDQPMKKRHKFFSTIESAFGISAQISDIKKNSILHSWKISKHIPNYLYWDDNKILMLDKFASNEMTNIIKENIPTFANFNFPSEICLDMIVELSDAYKIPKNYIIFYVNYYNVSRFSIKKILPDSDDNIAYSKDKRYHKSKNQDIITIMISTLWYLNKNDYLNLLVLNKEISGKVKKSIYKTLWKQCGTSDNKTRWVIWENIWKIKQLKKDYDYPSLWKQSLENINLNESDIYMDITRTFICGKLESREKEVQISLTNILIAIEKSLPTFKYCQGMNYIAEFLYEITNSEEETFYLLLGFLISTEYPIIFAKDIVKLNIFFYVFKRWISLFEPELYSYFNANSVDVHSFMPSWFITLFMRTRPFIDKDVTPIVWIRIIDMFLLSGWKSLMRVGMLLLHNYEQDLMKMGYDDMLQFWINDMWKFDFFKKENWEKIEKCLGETKIQKRWVKNIQIEYEQNEKFQ